MRHLVAVALLSLVATPLLAQEPVQPENTIDRQQRESVSAQNFMVAAANPIAARVGYEVLKMGGSAADAAVAVQIMLNLVEPQSSGIGGGSFALYWDATRQELSALDGREKAPAAATPAYWIDPETKAPLSWWEAVVGGRSVGVPGTLKLLQSLHQRHGRLPWAMLFEPTIDLARQGFPISPRLAGAIAQAKEKKLDLFEPTKSYFFQADGAPRAEGEVLRNPAFAETLTHIAYGGADAFYEGPMANDIAQATRTPINAGIMEPEDLSAYEVIVRTPVCTPYRSFDICGMPPPTSGGVAIAQIMGLLSHFDLPAMRPGRNAWHLLTEAERLAYADRARYLADADFVPVPVDGLVDPAYLKKRAKLINSVRASKKANFGLPPRRSARYFAPDSLEERPGTSHFVIVDSTGDMISMTSSIETGFGSRVMVGGFLLNNELTDFSRAPEKNGLPVANRVEGGKRPRSSMSPTVVFKDGEPHLLIGSPGGSRIIGYVAQALIAILDFDLDPQAALNLGHVVNRNGATDLEKGSEAAALKETFEAMGHEVALRDLNSGLHAIMIKPDGLLGGADPRREGVVLGR